MNSTLLEADRGPRPRATAIELGRRTARGTVDRRGARRVGFGSLAIVLGPMAVASLIATAPVAQGAPVAPAHPPAAAGTASPGGAAGTTSSPAAAASTTVRSVDAIVADLTAAVGGTAAMEKHHSLHLKMEITFEGLGITGSAEHFGTTGDRALAITEIPSLASTREGSDGTRFWAEDPINGLRVLDGAEAEAARVESAWNPELRLRELFPKIEAHNDKSGDGRRVECLTLTPKLGPSLVNCYDAETHLLISQSGTRPGPQGSVPFVARPRDWRTVRDVKVPYVTETKIGPLGFTAKVTLVELDVPIDPAIFAMPKAPPARGGGSTGATRKSARGKSRPDAGKGASRAGAKAK